MPILAFIQTTKDFLGRQMMKILIAISILILSATQAHARWHCELSCIRSVDTVYSKIDRHASGADYSDFNAECAQVNGTSTFPGESGCQYVYCKKFSKAVDVLNGEGESLTEARQNARSGCQQGGSNSCGIMNFNQIGNYNCHEM